MPRLAVRWTIAFVACAAAVSGAMVVATRPGGVRTPTRVPSLVHDRLVSAQRDLVAHGYADRDVVSVGGPTAFGPAWCHPAIVVGQRPRPGELARRGSVVEVLAGPASIRCRGAMPRGEGAVLGLLASSGAIWSGDVVSSGTIVASSHVSVTGALRTARVGRSGVFQLLLPSGEWHLTGFTRRLVDGSTGTLAACDGGDVDVRGGRTTRVNVVCVAL